MKKYKVSSILIIIIMSFWSCSFDKMFLRPSKLDHNTSSLPIVCYFSGNDLVIKFDNKFNPTFFDIDNQIIEYDIDFNSVFFENEAGYKLHGWIMSPKSDYNGVTILFLHGNAGNITSHYQIAKPLVNKGFRVLLFDYSGFGLSDGKATRKNVVIDAEAALNFLINEIGVTNDKLFIYGQSLGGNLAAKIAADHQDKIRGVIIEGAFSSHKDIAAYVTKLGFIARMLTKELYSSENEIAKFNKPVLVIHSTQDEIIPYFMGKKIYNSANKPKSFLKIDNRHIRGPIYHTERITEEILKMK